MNDSPRCAGRSLLSSCIALVVGLLYLITNSQDAVAELPVLRPIVSAAPGLKGLDAAHGQHQVRLATLRDSRTVVVYAQGYPVGCKLFDACKQYPQTWHFVADTQGLRHGPFRTWPELDVRPNLNNYSRVPDKAVSYRDGEFVVVGLAHSSHNQGGGNFLRIDGQGRVLSRTGGVEGFGSRVCALGRDLVSFLVWSDPASAGYAWFEDAARLKDVVNLGGYGYNFPGTQDFTCGTSATLGGRFSLVVREVTASHFGFMLYRAEGPRWSAVGSEVRVPWSVTGQPCCGNLVVGDDTGIVLAKGVGTDGRRALHYLRFRLTAAGVVPLDVTPRALPLTNDSEHLDSSLVYGGGGQYFLALYEGGQAAAGRPKNRRQALRILALDFAKGEFTDLVRPYEDDRWSQNAPLGFYANSMNENSLSASLACDGTLYVGAAFDNGRGLGLLRLFALPVGRAVCAAGSPG